MASAAYYPPNWNRPLSVESWNKTLRSIMKQVAVASVEGVGVTGTDVWEFGEVSAIVRRLCTDEERARVTERYIR